MYSFYLQRPRGLLASFDCEWLVAMTEKESRNVRVGCGRYHWEFDAAPPHLAHRLVITIAEMQVFPPAAAIEVLSIVASITYPWSSAAEVSAAAADCPVFDPVSQWLRRSAGDQPVVRDGQSTAGAAARRSTPTPAQHMDAPAPGHYWKTPFIWEPGAPEPPAAGVLRYEPAAEPWLRESIAAVMTHSLDESDRYTIEKIGIDKAVEEVYQVSAQYFDVRAGWWRAAIDSSGRKVGFVLTAVFSDPSRWKENRPQGTIVYMGVLPGFLGRGYALELILEATRTCIDAGCWRIFCDTGSNSSPVVAAFRKAGYQERKPWQRPLA